MKLPAQAELASMVRSGRTKHIAFEFAQVLDHFNRIFTCKRAVLVCATRAAPLAAVCASVCAANVLVANVCAANVFA